MSHLDERIEILRHLHATKQGDEKPGWTILRALRLLDQTLNSKGPTMPQAWMDFPTKDGKGLTISTKAAISALEEIAISSEGLHPLAHVNWPANAHMLRQIAELIEQMQLEITDRIPRQISSALKARGLDLMIEVDGSFSVADRLPPPRT